MKNLILTLLLTINSAFAGEWNHLNNPSNFGVQNYKFYNLVTSAYIPFNPGPWSGYHWPNSNNSLHYTPRDQRFSPIEKWEMADLDNRFYDIRHDVDEILRTNRDISWGGFCHGFAAASLEYKEPTKVIANGVKFFHSDIKAIMAFYYHYLLKNNLVKSFYIGSSCQQNLELPNRSYDSSCEDVNAGAFHLALNHKLFVEQKGFVMDISPGNEIWNVPVIGYKSHVLGDYQGQYGNTARGTVEIKHLKTVVDYLTYQAPEIDKEVPGLEGQIVKNRSYEYTLELDRFGNIIGGEWLASDRPDFLWYSSPFPRPSGEFEFLNLLIPNL